METRYSSAIEGERLLITIRGGHRQQRSIQDFLGLNPEMHSGLAGRGACCAYVTPDEFERLKEAGFNVAKRRL